MICLRNFDRDDIAVLREWQYPQQTYEDIGNMIARWNEMQINGRYFEMFAVERDGAVVGSVSLYQHSQNVISCGPDIFAPCRRQGIGEAAMRLALDIAREKGYKAVLQQIRVNNTASIALHRKLGFESDGYVFCNQHGNEVCLWIGFLH